MCSSDLFDAECETLRYTRHRNLVKVITVCSSIDSRGGDFKALVFEFLPNRNLEQWLHKHLEEDNEPKALGLIERLQIAMDVASALDYLHHHKPFPIVHCDLKPSNIILDDDMVAHVGDFGLARFLHEEHSDKLNDSTSGNAIRGTIGYVAPGMYNSALLIYCIIAACCAREQFLSPSKDAYKADCGCQFQSMDWATKLQYMVMSTAMVYFCSRCSREEDQQALNLEKCSAFISTYKWHCQTKQQMSLTKTC